MWLMKVKESQQFQFFASDAIIFMLMNFNRDFVVIIGWSELVCNSLTQQRLFLFLKFS